MKTALGLDKADGFPYQLTPLKTKNYVADTVGGFQPASAEHKEIVCQLDCNLCHAGLFLHGEVQRDIRANKARAQLCGRVKSMVRRAKYEVLAAAAQLRGILRDARLWNIKRDI